MIETYISELKFLNALFVDVVGVKTVAQKSEINIMLCYLYHSQSIFDMYDLGSTLCDASCTVMLAFETQPQKLFNQFSTSKTEHDFCEIREWLRLHSKFGLERQLTWALPDSNDHEKVSLFDEQILIQNNTAR
ncbi:hypothetical protein CEXT_393961 [Caerostris extrusa]|uniref:Uncharacterized protein n=1 Tax=Caerostris extrusa TaxID=172846 RepID=A0AAV4RHA2_CAEEX|nr:hypothetical protein CEXT_393961 [Caerostris extrusa]